MPRDFTPAPNDADFDKFWALYPWKQNKGDARKAWLQTQSLRPPTDRILKAILGCKNSDQWRRENGRYIPLPASWLRGERWEDAYEKESLDAPENKLWWQTASGIEAKGSEFNLRAADFSAGWQEFKAAVFQSAGHNITEIKVA